ncbi:MAG: tail fiber protein [Bacteroides sp.]|nr:tail fiber protein [Bacteroides sp.]
MMLGNIAGDKVILQGCALTNSNTRRDPGYVFLRTIDHPEGEVLYFEGGNVSSGLYLKVATVPVSAQGKEYEQAYTVRTLAASTGTEKYSWADFRDIKTVYELEKELESLRSEVGSTDKPRFGFPEMFCGQTLSDDYVFCDGADYPTSQYPKLYAALGTKYNRGYDCDGRVYSDPGTGRFRVPDLRKRFIVGYHPSTTAYNTVGKVGGLENVTLTLNQIPAHTHEYERYERGSKDLQRFSHKSNYDNPDMVKYNTTSAGGGQSHENRPPFYVLALVLRAK